MEIMADEMTCSLAVELRGVPPTQASLIVYYPDQQIYIYIYIHKYFIHHKGLGHTKILFMNTCRAFGGLENKPNKMQGKYIKKRY